MKIHVISMKIHGFFTIFFAFFLQFFCTHFDQLRELQWKKKYKVAFFFFVKIRDFLRFFTIFLQFFYNFFVLILISLESWIGKKGCKLAFFCVVLRGIFNAYFDGHFLSKTAFSVCHWDFSRQIFVLFFRQNSWFVVIFHYFFAIFCTNFDEFLARCLSWFAKNWKHNFIFLCSFEGDF